MAEHQGSELQTTEKSFEPLVVPILLLILVTKLGIVSTHSFCIYIDRYPRLFAYIGGRDSTNLFLLLLQSVLSEKVGFSGIET